MRGLYRHPWPLLTAAATGAFLSFAYPKFSFEPALWLAPACFLGILWFDGRTDRHPWYRPFLLGYLFGYLFFALSLSWLGEVHLAGALLLPAYLAVYPALFASFAATIGRPHFRFQKPSFFGNSAANLKSAALNSAAWTALEWLRSVAFTGFGWNSLGVGLWKNAPLNQLAEYVGATGLSSVVVFTASIVAGLIWRLYVEFRARALRPHIDFAVLSGVLIAVTFHGIGSLTQPKGNTLPIRTLLVQLNIPQDQKWDSAFVGEIYQKYRDHTQTYTTTFDFDLVVWPESALPIPLDYPFNVGFLNELLESGEFTLALGVNDEVPFSEGETYNALALLNGAHSNDLRQVYRKHHLVPFGEYIPLRDSFPPFEWVAGGLLPSDFLSGEEPRPMDIHGTGVSVIPAVCFEDTIGALLRSAARESEPQIILNVTNDGWFGESAGSEQHLANALLRTVELRRPMIRSCNTGISCLIDENGRIIDKIADPITGSTFVAQSRPVSVEVPSNPPLTAYARHGELFSKLCFIGTSLAILLQLAREAFCLIRRRRRSTASL